MTVVARPALKRTTCSTVSSRLSLLPMTLGSDTATKNSEWPLFMTGRGDWVYPGIVQLLKSVLYDSQWESGVRVLLTKQIANSQPCHVTGTNSELDRLHQTAPSSRETSMRTFSLVVGERNSPTKKSVL